MRIVLVQPSMSGCAPARYALRLTVTGPVNDASTAKQTNAPAVLCGYDTGGRATLTSDTGDTVSPGKRRYLRRMERAAARTSKGSQRQRKAYCRLGNDSSHLAQLRGAVDPKDRGANTYLRLVWDSGEKKQARAPRPPQSGHEDDRKQPNTARTLTVTLLVVSAFIATIFATGATFGQRCEAKGFKWNSAPFHACVDRLATGQNKWVNANRPSKNLSITGER